ncbi:MAG: phasin family protein [Blastocatellia bacterium]|nr:phasin family protein [Blastocatellia bacterium]
MEVQRDEMTAGVDRLNGVLGWWGAQGNRAIEARIEKFQQLTGALHKAYGEACRYHIDALTATNDRVSRSFQGLFHSRTPDELFIAEAEILTALMEAASLNMKAWSDLTQKVQSCCIDVARGTASDISDQAREVTSAVEEVAQTEQRRARRAARDPETAA